MRLAGLVGELCQRHPSLVLAPRPVGQRAGKHESPLATHWVDITRTEQTAAAVAGLGRWPLQVAMYHLPSLRRALALEIRRFEPDVVVLVLARLGSLIGDCGAVPVVVDLVDCLGLNMAQRAARQRWAGPLLNWEGRRMLRWERRLIEQTAAAVVVSERDRQALVLGHPEVAKRLRVVPLGLPLAASPRARQPSQPRVILTGNLGYFPTVEGISWLLRRVWPRIRRARPDAELWLAGSRPTRAQRRLHGRSGIRLIAEPSDLAELRRQAAVAIAPLRSGSGTPIKILEAMAEGLPVVTTLGGAAGLDDLSGGELAVAADSQAFAEQLLALLDDPPAAARQAQKAHRWLVARHSLRSSAAAFEAMLATVIGEK